MMRCEQRTRDRVDEDLILKGGRQRHHHDSSAHGVPQQSGYGLPYRSVSCSLGQGCSRYGTLVTPATAIGELSSLLAHQGTEDILNTNNFLKDLKTPLQHILGHLCETPPPHGLYAARRNEPSIIIFRPLAIFRTELTRQTVLRIYCERVSDKRSNS